jgi:type IV secretory pathway VirB4 component
MTKRSRTKLDQEKFIKQQQAEGEYYLDQITQSDEAKAADIIIEKGKEAEKASKEDEARKIEELEVSRRYRKLDYVRKLATMTNELFQHVDLPKGYIYRINFNEEKLNIIIATPDGKRFGRGIKPTGATTYDFHAIGVLVMQSENTIDKLEKRGNYREDGIILPNA